jgi:hypothetical protein
MNTPMKVNPTTSLLTTLSAILAVFYVLVTSSMATPPDLTDGGVQDPTNNRTFNLGPTGMRGWAYYVSTADTSESRQILVDHVESGSPAATVDLAVGDVILGADGTGTNPVNFSSDARKSLAYAIQDAEARSTPALKLLRWRAGTTTTTVTLTLQELGAYTATAPYSCPKSALILQQGLDYVSSSESVGNYSFGGLTHLATGDPDHLAKAQTAARALIPSASYRNYLMADERDMSGGLPVWDRGHKLIFLAEYYLATNDAQVLPAIEAYAINIANNRSLFGTFGHGFADWKHGPIGGGYGTVSSAGMPCMLGLLLAKECGLSNPELDPAIEAANSFFAWYSGKGAIPYGDHEPYMAYESNGKNGLGAIYFGLQDNRAEEGKFFSQMATASSDEREWGHTGSFFNYLWAPLGAAQGGEEAAAAYFGKISWMLDLNRCWDGRFVYDCLNGEGPISSPLSDTYHDFKMSTAALLTYALPHRKLRITGKGQVADLLTSTDVTEAVEAKDYDVDSRNNSQLIADLGNWSPIVRLRAAEKLGTNGVSGTELSQIAALAQDTNGSSGSRSGACLALGQIGDSSSAGVLVALLSDSDNYVRFSAAEGMRHLPTSANLVHLDAVLAAAVSNATPLLPLNEEDPMQFAHGRIAMLLFYGGGVFGPAGIISGDGIDGVDRNLLYPAIRAVAETAHGSARSCLYHTYQNLDYNDVLALSESIVDSIIVRAPSDRMFNHGVRAGGVAILRQHNIAEGVPAGMIYAADTVWNGGNRREAYNMLGAYGGSVTTVTPDPETIAFLESYLGDSEVGATVQGILNAIAADTNPTPLNAFKSIQSATADDPILTLPANSTVLRVSGLDHMQGDTIYTWRKILGPGGVTISPNGTSDTVSNLQFDGTPGTYQFEVTMSDSRGFTEVYETVTAFLREEDEVDNDPPVPNPASFAVAPAAGSETAISMTAALGSDVSGPVEYLFSEITGNPGGTSSSWQTSPTYTDSGLNPLTQYAYMVTMRDSLGNTGTTSSAVSVTTPGTPPPSDIISVNFYAYGAMNADDYDAVTLEADESAGFGGWDTAGWENYAVPWGLSSPAGPAAIASELGSTATLTLNDVRNGGPYAWSNPHALLPGDGNGDLMDGHCNATEDDPGDGSGIFDMTLSNIGFDTYDVIVYLGSNRDQFGDGTAKYIFNGSAEQGFTLTSGEFSSFAEITNSTTPGNYLLFKNVTGSSFTLQVWGNGFNHIGPTGFQIASAGSTSDVNPPTPNPASFAAPPYANGTTAVSMTATAGSDASGSVEYLFSCLTAGGHGSGWQTSPSYTDRGLNPGTQYTYTVTMRDALGNTGNASDPASATTTDGPDLTAPNPDPMTWAVAPAAGSTSLIVHEDFNYSSGGSLTGSGGAGFDAAWVTTRSTQPNTGYFEVNTTGLTFTDTLSNNLPVSGKSAYRSEAGGRSEANRVLSADARAALLPDGSTMWFSVLHERSNNNEYAAFVLGTGTFDVAAGYKLDVYTTGGEGFGFGSSKTASIEAIGYDNSAGLTKVVSSVDASVTRLIVGKIVWSANGSDDTLTLYNVTDLTSEPTTAIATVSADLDQVNFDRIALFSNQASAVYDEIRLGTSFTSVVGGGSGNSDDTITMTATTATDASDVEYYFTETSGNPGGNDSGWQTSPVYIDTGLQSGTQYTYTVMARDKSPNQNTTAPSAAANATTTGSPPANATPYADWAVTNVVTGGFGDDDDDDGTLNGHAWYFSNGPAQITGLAETGPGAFEFTHVRPMDRDDVTETYQWSRDLVTWHTADGSATDGTNTVDIADKAVAAGPTANYETVTLEATVAGPVTSDLFFRLKLSTP